MSELQIGLLAIGIVVVIGVYGYGFWQQRQYRRKFGGMFDTQRPDVLGQEVTESPQPAAGLAQEPLLDLTALEAEAEAVSPVFSTDSLCDQLEGKTDYIATFTLPAPQNCEFLAPLWDRRFVFGKSVNVCGMSPADGQWERIVPESRASYATFRVALQLVDRTGAVSEARLDSFHELMQQIVRQLGVELEIASVADALQRAQQLDEFCANADRMIGLNILMREGSQPFASEIAQIVQLLGFSLQADGSFHLLDGHGQTLYTLGDCSAAPFQHHTLNQTRVQCLTLLLDVPRVTQPVARFDEMAALAEQLAKELKGALVDDNRRELSEASIAHIRAQVLSTEADMLAGGIPPGSAQALRLFS